MRNASITGKRLLPVLPAEIERLIAGITAQRSENAVVAATAPAWEKVL